MISIGTSEDSPKEKFLFSLKWKSFLIISLILVAVNGAYYFYLYTTLDKGFHKERVEKRAGQREALKTLISHASKELTSIANLIPGLNGIKDLIDSNQWSKVNTKISEVWPSIQVDYDIDGIIFFNSKAEAVIKPDFNHLITLEDGQLQNSVKEVISQLIPQTKIVCSDVCIHVAIVPYMSNNKGIRAIAVFSSIADIIQNYSQLEKVNLGVITQVPSAYQSPQNELINWNSRIVALTDAMEMQTVIHSFSNKYTYHDAITNGNLIQEGSSHYDVAFVPLNTRQDGSESHFVIIDDVSDEVGEMDTLISDTLTQSILGLIISELAILLVLWKPMSRLRMTSEVLPLLASGEFSKARLILKGREKKSPYFIDEIDLVGHSSISLSRQLEKLNQDIASYTQSLAENMKKLEREKDFTSFLLDTAQVIIVTLDKKGIIRHINRYGIEMMEKTREDIIDTRLDNYVYHQKDSIDLLHDLKEVVVKKLDGRSNETRICTGSGAKKTIAWVHSYITSKDRRPAEVLSVGVDITERKRAEKSIEWLANHDPLTGLYNRRYFNEVFDNYLKQGERYNRSGALLFLDLDNFKFVNDTKGHQAGDKLIKEVAQSLKRITRNADIISRVGGDEFAIVIPDIDKDSALEFCRDLNRRINIVIKPLFNTQHQVSTSIGVALFPQHGMTVSQLLANADIAMYQAKDKGKGGWHLFSEQEQAREKIQSHVDWKQKLEHAINEDGLVLFYQPIMEINSRKVNHYEVLVRMKDGADGFLSPRPFIEVAENSGLIHELDRVVVTKAINQIKSISKISKDIALSVNLSAHTFSDRKNLPILIDILNSSGINRNNIIFEITETAALQDIGAACELIEKLARMGCRFAIDDFGVGFSSFYYLRELPVDYVKIDGSFIQQLSRSRDDQIIVRAMTQIVKGFGKKAIAEYVEDENTLELLRQYGVDYAQGYHIGVPTNKALYREPIAV